MIYFNIPFSIFFLTILIILSKSFLLALYLANSTKEQRSKHILIEKHVKLKESKGPDAATSINTDELTQLVHHINIIRKLKIEKKI